MRFITSLSKREQLTAAYVERLNEILTPPELRLYYRMKTKRLAPALRQKLAHDPGLKEILVELRDIEK